MSTSSADREHENTVPDPVQQIVEERRAEVSDGPRGRERDSSHTDNPTFAAQVGTSTDGADGELDYVEEPGVGGVSGERRPAGPDDAGTS
jgi:hypothetical protein